MPKRVDHVQRQREIAEALWRIVAVRGLQAVTLREVAAEAGISMNLVQYYFKTKDQMLHFAWQRVGELTGARVGESVSRALMTGDTRAIIRAYLTGALPVDERNRMLCAVQIAYFAVDVADRAQAAEREQLVPHLTRALADLIRAGQEEGRIPQELDAELEADALTATAGGLLSGLMVDHFTVERAMAVVDHRLDQLFTKQVP